MTQITPDLIFWTLLVYDFVVLLTGVAAFKASGHIAIAFALQALIMVLATVIIVGVVLV